MIFSLWFDFSWRRRKKKAKEIGGVGGKRKGKEEPPRGFGEKSSGSANVWRMGKFGCENFGCEQILLGRLYHGTHRNASLCGTERAEKHGFHAVQPQFAHFAKSACGIWTHGSEVSEGLIHAAFSVPRTWASVCSVVVNLAEIVRAQRLDALWARRQSDGSAVRARRREALRLARWTTSPCAGVRVRVWGVMPWRFPWGPARA